MIYTTDAIEALNRQLHKAIEPRAASRPLRRRFKLMSLLHNAIPQPARTRGWT